MTVGQITEQPIGHRVFCATHAIFCRKPNTPNLEKVPKPVELTTALIIAIAGINTMVNTTISSRSDQSLYGVKEYWTFPDAGAGDCEDYALMKQRMIADLKSVAAGNLLITVVRKRDGEGHAVLTLRTTSGDFVLDNLDWRIRMWKDSPYTFVKRQSVLDPSVWVDVESDGQLLVGSVAK